MTINAEFLAGTDIKQAIQEAKEKALEFGFAYVKFNFNGVSFSIGRNCDVIAATNEYIKTKSGGHICFS